MRIVAVGRLKAPEADLFARYAARLNPKPLVVELPDAAGGPALLAELLPKAFVIALDAAGAAPDTEGFATLLATWRDSRRLCASRSAAPTGSPARCSRAPMRC